MFSNRQQNIAHLNRCFQAEFREPVQSKLPKRYLQWMHEVCEEIAKEPEPETFEEAWNSLFG